MTSEQEFRDDGPLTAARDSDREAEAEGRESEDEISSRVVTIGRPRDQIYAFWRDFSNLERIMENVERIEVLDDRRSRWSVKGPAGSTYQWESLIVEDEPGRLIAWQSAEGSEIRNSGRVEFIDAAPGRGTIVKATIAYDPPGGLIGEWIAKLFQREPNIQARRDLRRLKQLLETGEVTSSASPSGRKSESPTEQAL